MVWLVRASAPLEPTTPPTQKTTAPSLNRTVVAAEIGPKASSLLPLVTRDF